MECVICGEALSGGIDTFGPLGLESCRSCWLEHGISGDYDPWQQLNAAGGTVPGDVGYLNKAAENVAVHIPRSRKLL